MDVLKLVNTLSATDPKLWPQVLRLIADVWEADPNLLAEFQAKNFGSIIVAIARKDPALFGQLINLVVKSGFLAP